VEIDVNGDEVSNKEMTCMEMDYNDDLHYFFEKFTDNVIEEMYDSEDEIKNEFTYVTNEELGKMLDIYRKNSPAEN